MTLQQHEPIPDYFTRSYDLCLTRRLGDPNSPRTPDALGRPWTDAGQPLRPTHAHDGDLLGPVERRKHLCDGAPAGQGDAAVEPPS